LTFRHTKQGSIGLLKNKKIYIAVASGGAQLDTELDFVSAYLRHTFGFIGFTDITFIDSSGLGNDETTVLSRCHAHIEQL
jgi:FMN-dependent NADH-azoreductase